MISFISIAPAMTSEVTIIKRQYCNYNPYLYSLASSKIITSKRCDQPSTYVYVALFILGKIILFIVTATPSTVNSFKVFTPTEQSIPHYLRKMSKTCRTRYEIWIWIDFLHKNVSAVERDQKKLPNSLGKTTTNWSH